MAISPEPFRTDCVRAFADRLIDNLSQPREKLTQESCFDAADFTTEDKVAIQRDVIEQQGKLLEGSFRSLMPYKETKIWSNDFWFTHSRYPGLAMQIMDQKKAEHLQNSMTAIRTIVQKEKFFFVKVPACFVLALPGYKPLQQFVYDIKVLYVEARLSSPLLGRIEQHEVVRRLFMHFTSQQANPYFVDNLKKAVAESISLLSKVEYIIWQKGPAFAADACFFHFHHFNDSAASNMGRKVGRFMSFFPDPTLLQGPMSLFPASSLARAQEKAKRYAVLFRTFDERKYGSAKALIALPQESHITFSENEAILRSYVLDEMQKTREKARETDQLFSSRCYRELHSSSFRCAVINDMMRDHEPFTKSLEELTKAIDDLMKTDHLRMQKNEEAEVMKQSITGVQKFIQKIKGQKPKLPNMIYPLVVATLEKMKAEGTVIQWFDSAHKHDRTTEKLAIEADRHIKYRIYF